jgi:hypothetical protein
MPSATIVLLAKCPTPGLSKTRLIPRLGSASAAADLARALLWDVLLAIDEIVIDETSTSSSSETKEPLFVHKLLVFAPASSQSEFEQILSSFKSHPSKKPRWLEEWTLLPIPDKALGKTSGTDNNLTDILKFALVQARQLQSTPGPVLFLGMDTPILPTHEIRTILARNVPHPDDSSSSCVAFLCPANDGGYGMVSVPCTAPLTIFDNIPWSTALTALAQIKAFTDHNIPIVLGPLMYDIDDETDLQYYIQRWSSTSSTVSSSYSQKLHNNINWNPASPEESTTTSMTNTTIHTLMTSSSILEQPSRWAMETAMQKSPPKDREEECPHTRQTLRRLGILPS